MGVVKTSGIAIGAVVMGSLLLAQLHSWPWNRADTLNAGGLIILAITAIAVILYARDSRIQTRALTRRNIQPRLSEEPGVWPPDLNSNSEFYVSSPDGSSVNARIMLKLWIGNELVPYNDKVDPSGLYSGRTLWTLTGGQFRGVVRPGLAFQSYLRNNYSTTLTVEDLFDSENQDLPDKLRTLPENERVRVQLVVRFPGDTVRQDDPEKTWQIRCSYLYYLRDSGQRRLSTTGARQNGYKWIPHPDAENLPPGANTW